MKNKDSAYQLIGLGVENFRIFRRYQYFDLKPITILTGTNNSGKSTLGKALLLLKNSCIKSHLNRLHLNSNGLVLGDLESVYSHGSDSENLQFDLNITAETTVDGKKGTHEYRLKLFYQGIYLHRFSLYQNGEHIAHAQLTYADNFQLVEFTNSYFHFPDEIVLIEKLRLLGIDNDELLDRFKQEILAFLRNDKRFHNDPYGYDFEDFHSSGFLPNFIKGCTVDRIGKVITHRDVLMGDGTVEDVTVPLIQNNAGEHLQLRDFLSEDLTSILSDDILNCELKDFVDQDYSLSGLVDAGFMRAFDSINNQYLETNFRDIVVSRQKYPNLYQTLVDNEKLKEFQIHEVLYYWVVQQLKLVKPSKLGFEKDRRVCVEESDGEITTYERRFIKIIEGKEWGEMLRIHMLSDDNWVDLSSLGYGTANLVIKLLQFFLCRNVLLVEEPEANLHPSLQSRLADILVQSTHLSSQEYIANPFSPPKLQKLWSFPLALAGSKKILETHSEYLIRRLRYLVASQESPITSDDVQIYYFNNPLEDDIDGENQVVNIKIQPDGSLTENFGTGFMDEADQMALDLYLLQYK